MRTPRIKAEKVPQLPAGINCLRRRRHPERIAADGEKPACCERSMSLTYVARPLPRLIGWVNRRTESNELHRAGRSPIRQRHNLLLHKYIQGYPWLPTPVLRNGEYPCWRDSDVLLLHRMAWDVPMMRLAPRTRWLASRFCFNGATVAAFPTVA